MRDTDPLFAEDGVRPSQFSVARVQARAEQALWGAVLAQALADLRGGASLNREKSQKRAQMMAAARAWIADQTWTGVGSFPWVCDVLGLDAARVRVRVALVAPARPGTEPPCWLKVDTLRGISRSGHSGRGVV